MESPGIRVEEEACREREGKMETFEKIKTLSPSAAKVKLSDVLHNMYETVEQIKDFGDKFLFNFSTSPARKIEYERQRLEEFKKCHSRQLRMIKKIEKYLVFLEVSVSKIS